MDNKLIMLRLPDSEVIEVSLFGTAKVELFNGEIIEVPLESIGLVKVQLPNSEVIEVSLDKLEETLESISNVNFIPTKDLVTNQITIICKPFPEIKIGKIL